MGPTFRVLPVIISGAVLIVAAGELALNFVNPLDTTPAPSRLAGSNGDMVYISTRITLSRPLGGVSVDNSISRSEPDDDRRVNLFINVAGVDPSARTVFLKVYVFVAPQLLAKVRGDTNNPSHSRVPILQTAMGSTPQHLDPRFADQKLTLLIASCPHEVEVPCDDVTRTEIPVASLVRPSGTDSLLALGAFGTTIVLPAGEATPQAFPGDGYALHLRAEVLLPAQLSIGPSVPGVAERLPVSAHAGKDRGFRDKEAYALIYDGSKPPDARLPIVNLYIFRSTAAKLYEYGVALTPILLALMVVSLLGSPKTARGLAHEEKRPQDVWIGLLAASLTILPLRAVLVPNELQGTAVTRMDLILALQLAVIVAVAASVYARGESNRMSGYISGAIPSGLRRRLPFVPSGALVFIGASAAFFGLAFSLVSVPDIPLWANVLTPAGVVSPLLLPRLHSPSKFLLTGAMSLVAALYAFCGASDTLSGFPWPAIIAIAGSVLILRAAEDEKVSAVLDTGR